jgi:hypothetical protein
VSPLSPQIRVTDSFGNPIVGAAIAVQVQGGGSVQFPNPTTNSNGFASVGTWTLGPIGGSQIVTLTAPGVPPLTFTVSTGSQFNIDIRYIGQAPSAAIQAVFSEAVSRLRQFVTGDLPDFSMNQSVAPCQPGAGVLNEVIDDLLILVAVGPIDGPGNTLGQAGPCYRRLGGGLPIVGRMTFDVADLNQLAQLGQLNTTITHEMIHVLGFGIKDFWDPSGLIQGAGGSNPLFVGAQAISAYRGLGGIGSTGVPLENCVGIDGCGAGTRDAHWRELSFVNELMTGFLDSGSNPMSRFSIAALADMGYSVSLSAADAYTVPSGNLRGAGGGGGETRRKIEMRNDVLPLIGEVSQGAMVEPAPRRRPRR